MALAAWHIERGGNDQERETLRLSALESLGRKEEAQRQRRLLFERWLDPAMLRAWLKALPDFEDFDAEQEALDFVMRFSDAAQALAFLVEWPEFHRADRLVQQRLADLDGRNYGVLRPSAEALEAEYPSAAALLYRLLVESVLNRGSSKYCLCRPRLARSRRPRGPAFCSVHSRTRRLGGSHSRKTWPQGRLLERGWGARAIERIAVLFAAAGRWSDYISNEQRFIRIRDVWHWSHNGQTGRTLPTRTTIAQIAFLPAFSIVLP